MTRWTVGIVVALLVLAVAAPAGAVRRFGPRVTVATATCDAASVSGDAVASQHGRTAGFVRFLGDDCGSVIHAFRGRDDTWRADRTPYRGYVLAAAADGGATLVLYAARRGTFVGRRTRGGAYREPVRVTRSGLGGGQIPTGDLVAAGGRWLAVYNRPIGPGGEFAQTELFSAQTLGRRDCFSRGMLRQRITRSNRNDDNPTLVLSGAAAGRARLVWDRNDSAQGLVANLRRGTQRLDTCTWTDRGLTSQGDLNIMPSLARDGRSELLAWWRDGAIRARGAFGEDRLGRGFGPSAALSADVPVVAWDGDGQRIRVAERRGGSWSRRKLGGGAQVLLAVTSRRGRATVVGLSAGSDRLFATTQRP